MKIFLMIVLGFAMGIVVDRFLYSNPTGALAPPMTHAKPAPAFLRQEKQLRVIGHDQKIGEQIPGAISHPSPSPAAAHPHRLVISLSESIVREMENQWNELPTQAEAIREPRGWRLRRIAPNSTFDRAGFRAGDLITTEFIDSLNVTSGVELAQRLEHILNRVTN